MLKNYLFKTIILIGCFLFLSPKSKAQCTYASSQSISAATFLACGSITINSGVTLTVTGAVTNNTGGLNITVTDNGSLVINGGITLNSNGNLSVSGTGSMSVTSGGLTINSSGSYTNGVNTTIAGGITGGNSGSIVNTGTLTVTSGNITLNSSGGLSNTGVVSVTGNVTIANSGSITNTGSFSVSSNITENSSGSFVDNGTLTVGGNYSLSNSGGISGTGTATVTGTASTTGSGTFFGSSTGCTGCTLSNAGLTLSPCDFKYRRLITIHHSQVSGGVDLTNFPMLVNITSDATLKSVGNGGHVQNANGYDIIFTASDGVTNLKFQLETYVATTGQYVAWVNIPLLSAVRETYIYMYYGDASVTTDQSSTSTWDANHVGVWHLNNNVFTDATSNGNNGTNVGGTNNATGEISSATSFSNATSNAQHVQLGMTGCTGGNGNGTVEFWGNNATRISSTYFFGESSTQTGGTYTDRIQLYFADAAGTLELGMGSQHAQTAIQVLALNTWYHIALTWATNGGGTGAGTYNVYVNGVLSKTGTYAGFNSIGTFGDIGNDGNASQRTEAQTGSIDEVHISKTARTAGWITTEYNNQSSPGTFYTLAGEPNTWVGTSSTAWNTGANWSSGFAPGSGVDVIITNGANQPTLNTNPQVNSIYINTGATLSLSAKNLSVYTDITTCGTFQGGTGTLILDGAVSGQVQTISGTGTYNIYDLQVINTSGGNPSVKLQQSITVNDVYTHTTGTLDLNGLGLSITSPTAAATSNFLAGSIMTSVAGGSLTVTDNNTKARINFEGTNFGDITNGVTINCSSNDSYFDGGIFYGTVNFTKTGSGTNDCAGGCTFYGPCTFNTTAAGDRWRMGNTNPDIFYNATFNHLCSTANTNFIVARQTLGNQFYGTTTINSQSPGGFYTGRNNTSANGSADFHGPVYVTVAQTGSVYFAESNATIQNSATFEDIIQINSTAGSTGNVSFGTASQSTITLTSTARFIAGTVLGLTDVYLTNLTQSGTTYTHTISSNAASGSTLHLGTIAACSFAGGTSFTFPTLQIANSTFNGATNSFVFTGSSNSNTLNGGNTFAAGTSTSFTNSGTGSFRLGVTAADVFNGNATFVQTNTGALSPAYSNNCNFGGNISTAGSTTAINFGTGNGTVTINGSGTQTFSGSSSFIPVIQQNLVMASTGTLSLSVPVQIATGGALTMTSGIITSSAANYLEMLDETNTTTTGSATSYVNGPMRYDVTATTLQTLNFPIGKSGDWRPVVLTIKHGLATQYNYTGEVFDANPWAAFGSVWPGDIPTATVDTISGVHYWTIARTDASGTSQPNANLSYSAGNYPLIQLNFGTNDGVYQGSNLTIVKNTSATPATWIDIGATCALSNFSSPQAGNIISTTSGTPFNSFSSFTLGSKNAGWNPLPIELLSFDAVANGDKVDLKWETVTETNNAYFTIEKSKDGKNFVKVIDVPGAGNSTNYRNYAEVDYQPYEGTSYYRLKQTDNNGAYKYFNVIPVNFTRKNNIVVFPNPLYNTTGGASLNVKVTGYQNQEVVVVLRDVEGREFLSKVLLTEDNNQLFVIDETKSLTPGAYIITASSNDKIYNYKLIVR